MDDFIRIERDGKPDQYISRRKVLEQDAETRRRNSPARSDLLLPLIPHPVPRFGSPFCGKCRGSGGTVGERCPSCGGSGYRL